jgi:ABC-type transport system involved in cytochrome c biogenesis permease subunit
LAQVLRTSGLPWERAIELALLAAATTCLAAATAIAWTAIARGRVPASAVAATLLLGLALQTGAIAVRWLQVGHGPYTTMFEILSSNVWSLSLVYLIAYWRLVQTRASAAVVLPILVTMAAWMLLCDRGAGHVPATYDTPWLWVHTLFGKIFLGSLLLALGLALVILLRGGRELPTRLLAAPDNLALDAIAYRFMALALIFESLMLIVGAIWAQDAWGRYWAWDPLETWAFLTWIALVGSLHARAGFKLSLRTRAALVPPVFVLAFLTFFGVPFISAAPHQGMM